MTSPPGIAPLMRAPQHHHRRRLGRGTAGRAFQASRRLFLLALLMILAFPLPPARAQGPCGVVDAIDYPLDPNQFSIVYRFGLPSTRFDGRYHAGDDWFGGRTATYGQPVHAIARGRVTYSAPLGWGRDKGVVIVEHAMPDGTWWYSLYGHMEETETIRFPAVYTCVERGDVVGAIGRPRPAPHLHLEIRNFGSDSPGPGYWATDPTASGWADPSKFIANWQGWLNPAHAWHADLTEESGPRYPAIIRPDGATIVYDNGRLKALNPSGQVLWRYILSQDLNVVGVLPYDGQILVADHEGRMQLWSQAGGFLEAWQLPHQVDTAPYRWGDLLVVHTPADELIAYGPDRVERWRVAGVRRPVYFQGTDRLLVVESIRHTMTFLAIDGTIRGRATLRVPGAAAPAPDGGLYVRSQAGLWHVLPDGSWTWLNDPPGVSRASSALYSLPDGRFFVYAGGGDRALYAYDAAGGLRWSVTLEGLTGRPFLLADGSGALLLADGYGQIVAIGTDSGAQCNQLHVWGSWRSGAWAGLGPDGVMRLHIGDQVLGLRWTAFAGGCR